MEQILLTASSMIFESTIELYPRLKYKLFTTWGSKPMNLRTRLSRSNGYRLLGMYDESILILEDIPPGKEHWDSLVVEAHYNTYRDAEVWGLANAMSGPM
jgi:hypothetical protein